MTPEEIRKARDEAYFAIKVAEAQLKQIRELCPHNNVSVGNYEWRTGSIIQGEICDDCGKFIKEV